MLLEMTATMLRFLGFTVLPVATPEEAMTLITTWPGTADTAPSELGLTSRPVRDTLATALDAWEAAGRVTRRQRGAPRDPGSTPRAT